MLIPNRYVKNDPVYLTAHEYQNPKEIFKVLTSKIKETKRPPDATLLDACCAAGGFIHYAKQHLSIRQYAGFDIADQAIAQAKQYMPDVEWIVGSLLDPSVMNARQFDVCVCIGSLAIFDDLKPTLENLLSFVKPGGELYVFDLVNQHPIDVLVRYRRTDATPVTDWQTALNVHSLKTYEKIIHELKAKISLEATDFRIGIPIPKTTDPMRAWTIRTDENPHQIVVGTNQLLDFKILRFQKH